MAFDAGEAGLPSLLLHAAQTAAAADGLTAPLETSDPQGFAKQQGLGLDHALAAASNQAASRKVGGKKKGPPLRRGKWTPEEEAYANRLIQEFKAGLLPLTDGTTLRTFLSKLLNCDPMRISKKFVGSNCIGKQVFRRRTADINRLTPDQIQQSRAELSELERRFLERVAQTNRVKSASGVGGASTSAAAASAVSAAAVLSGGGGGGGGGHAHQHLMQNHASLQSHFQAQPKEEPSFDMNPPSPPWLQPPLGYKQGSGAAMAASNLSGGESKSRAAAAGRALLQGLGGANLKGLKERKQPSQQQQQQQQQQHASNPLTSQESAGLLAMAELQRRASQNNFFSSNFGGSSASDILAAAAAARNGSNSALAQIARNASAARLAASGNSMNSLMMKTGLSRDQLSQLARDKGLSSASLTNMMERQNSFDALMSLDFQSLQSIDNLANLIQTGGAGQVPEGGMKNWSADSRSNLAAAAAAAGSTGNLSNAARRLASAGRMESLLRSLSSAGNLGNELGGGSGDANKNTTERASGNSNANFSSLLQSMQSNLNNFGGGGGSTTDFLNAASGNSAGRDGESGGNANNMASAVSLANLLRPTDSSTGLTALRMQEGLNQRNSSVDDFLSLVAAGDIPHQDPSLLNIPLMQQQAAAAGGDPQAAAAFLAQRQLLAKAAQSRSFQNLAGGGNPSAGNLNSSSSAAAFAMAARGRDESSNQLKRKLLDLEGVFDGQGQNKR
ncbi:expressed unknown protein [Seminavis robusta]|uniref:Uncharacterized protein n=1 Tax=Seminavis robusta TaxID=568900 RepID=A0A9N8HIQ5_9STRA|nr:expressed unknown protein [Seminavis robusta]|eukprot:Sro514_g157970.1 n/a (731) ;mRNA; r:8043-10461